MRKIKEKPLSIAELSRSLKMKRENTRYYLNILKNKDWIIFERQKNLSGQPTLIKINYEQFKKEWAEMELKSKEYEESQKKSPYTKAIIDYLKTHKRASLDDLIHFCKDNIGGKDFLISRVLSTLQWLNIKAIIKEYYELN